jgi:hypothetical protein
MVEMLDDDEMAGLGITMPPLQTILDAAARVKAAGARALPGRKPRPTQPTAPPPPEPTPFYKKPVVIVAGLAVAAGAFWFLKRRRAGGGGAVATNPMAALEAVLDDNEAKCVKEAKDGSGCECYRFPTGEEVCIK